MDPALSLPLLLALMLCNALLTAGRTALTVLRDSSVKKLAASGDRKAILITNLLEHPTALLEGLKLAGFSCTVLLSLGLWPYLLRSLGMGARALSLDLALPQLAHWTQLILSLVLTVLLLNILCLSLPYRVACRYAQPIAFALVGFCRIVALLMRPLVWLCARMANLLSVLFGVRGEQEDEQVTEEEIRLMVDVGNEKGAIEQSEKDMINNIFEFDDRSVSEVMTHRTDMVAVQRNVPLDSLASVAIESGYSRIPVFEDDIDDIVGIVYVKDLLCLIGRHEADFSIERYMRPALFIPENMGCVDLFAQFKIQKVQVAVAVDEYGGTAGIVSMEDLLESIVGNIQDEYDDEEEEILAVNENCYLLDGAVAIDEVERLFDVVLEDEEESDYDTIGGLLTEHLERIPAPDEHPTVTIGGILFTVLLVEDRHIARIQAERPANPDEPKE